MNKTPTLENDSFIDKAIATASICLWNDRDGEITNATQLLIRPLDVRGDESGDHPGEEFVMVTITREEMREMTKQLDADWADHIAVMEGCTAAPQGPTANADLQSAAQRVVEAFEALGRTNDVAALLQARAQCETSMAALKTIVAPTQPTAEADQS